LLIAQAPAQDKGGGQLGRQPEYEEPESVRELINEKLIGPRPPSSKKRGRREVEYKRVTPPLPKSVGPRAAGKDAAREKAAEGAPLEESSVVGLTFWRLRRSVEGDRARMLVHGPGSAKPSEFTPERIEAETPLGEGDMVRVSVESPVAGYLYVIDREEYAGGRYGDAYLIFPTARTRSGDNRVEAGRVVEIPAQDDTPPYWTMRSLGAGQVGEVLTIIISARPLDFAAGREALKLRPGQAEEWEQKWGARVARLEQVGGHGTAWTPEEKEAGGERPRHLTQNEPLPQTVYHVAAKPGVPLLLAVRLRYGAR
jgi:hypothetical protein